MFNLLFQIVPPRLKEDIVFKSKSSSDVLINNAVSILNRDKINIIPSNTDPSLIVHSINIVEAVKRIEFSITNASDEFGTFFPDISSNSIILDDSVISNPLGEIEIAGALATISIKNTETKTTFILEFADYTYLDLVQINISFNLGRRITATSPFIVYNDFNIPEDVADAIRRAFDKSIKVTYKLSKLAYNPRKPFCYDLTLPSGIVKFNSNNRTYTVNVTEDVLTTLSTGRINFLYEFETLIEYHIRVVQNNEIVFISDSIDLGTDYSLPNLVNIGNTLRPYELRFYFNQKVDPKVFSTKIESAHYKNPEQYNLFDTSTGSLSNYFSSSSSYKTDVYCNNTRTCKQFSLIYGHFAGSGSTLYPDYGTLADSPTRAIYSQIKSIIGQVRCNKININGSELESVLGIMFDRENKDENLSCNINFGLHAIGSNYNELSGSTLRLFNDNFNIVSESGEGVRYSPIISGSCSIGGAFYEKNLIVLDPTQIDAVGLNFSGSGFFDCDNLESRLFLSLSGSAASGSGFCALRERDREFFVYNAFISPTEFNLSNNPSYRKFNCTNFFGEYIESEVTKSIEGRGRLRFENRTRDSYSMIDNPFSYVTTIGLYDENYDLLAVGKLSAPVQKRFGCGFGITVKIEE